MSDDDISFRLSKASSDRYLDEHMEKTCALHRKLQSKTEALRIIRKELERFRTERDQFKLMAETLQLRYSAIRRNTDLTGCGLGNSGNRSVATILHETREQNIKLTTEIETLKQKLNELQGDIEILRGKEFSGSQERKLISEQEYKMINAHEKELLQWKEDRANFICHLENLKKKNAQLSFDFKAVIDEKEELIMERDAYKCKAHRLNHELLMALKANEMHPKFIDIDSIILENKYLQERLKSYENELDLAKQSASKYKSMCDAKRKKGIIKLGTNCHDESILSHKQAKHLLESGIELPTKTETIQDLKSLCLALLDNLNDKNLALSHQKKANKVLASKISELEQRIQAIVGFSQSTATPSIYNNCSTAGYSSSQILLQDYCSSSVDIDSSSATNELKDSTIQSDDVHNEGSDSVITELSEHDYTKKTPIVTTIHVNSDDGMSSTESSGRSVLSSEYGVDIAAACSLSEFTNHAMFAYNTPSTTTDSGKGIDFAHGLSERQDPTLLPSSLELERMEDLKGLPPDLAALVQKALHELDVREFDENIESKVDMKVQSRIPLMQMEEEKKYKQTTDGDEDNEDVANYDDETTILN